MVSSGHVTVTSGEKGPTRADIAQLPVTHAQNILPNRASSGHVTSGHFRSCHFRSSIRNDPISLDPPQMLLCNHPYTTFFPYFRVICPFPAILFSLSVSYKHRARHPRIISSLDNRNSRGKPGLVMKELSTLFT